MDGYSLESATNAFWAGRDDQAQQQESKGAKDAGTRGSVTGGQHLNAFRDLIVQEISLAGIADSEIHTSRARLPGRYRPAKDWDIVAIREGCLVAAVELKSMVGSVGNNINNRAEEAIGNAVDLRRAYDTGLVGPTRPWLGYFFVLGGSSLINRSVNVQSRRFPLDPEMDGATYAQRYQLLMQRMVEDNLYDAGCFIISEPGPPVLVQEPSDRLSFESFRTGLRSHISQVLRR